MAVDSSVALVSRSIRLSNLERDSTRAVQALDTLPSVTSVTQGTGSLRVLYDPSRIDYAAVQATLHTAGVELPAGRWARLKTAWFSYLDGNARANANAGTGSCCSNPTDVYSRRGRRG